jgi:ABC-2 type transport system ATP-binding protein
MTAVLELGRVHAEDGQAEGARALGALHGVTLSLSAGVHALLGRPEDGTLAVCEIASGKRRARVGTVRVGGRDPRKSAAARRRIGAVLARPDLPEVPTVSALLDLVAALRGARPDLERLGLGSLGERSPASLRADEARAVELAIALATPAPLLVALYEPFGAVAQVDRGELRAVCLELAAGGACVLVATSVPSDAAGMADRVHLLEHGELLASDAVASLGDLLEPQALVLWIDADGEELRGFAAALGEAPAVRGVAWDRGEGGAPAVITVHAAEVEGAALAIADTVRARRARVVALWSATPALDALRVAARARHLRPWPAAERA